MSDLEKLAALLKARTEIDNQIATLLGRPAHVGHLGEFIAAAIFNIGLERSATHKGSDGVFASGPLAGRSVNIKLYSKDTNQLDIHPDQVAGPDYYLVLVGPRSRAVTSRGTSSPVAIAAVFLFDAKGLVGKLEERGVKIGTASSVHRQLLWAPAEIYPEQRNTLLPLSEEQRRQLALFAPEPGPAR